MSDGMWQRRNDDFRTCGELRRRRRHCRLEHLKRTWSGDGRMVRKWKELDKCCIIVAAAQQSARLATGWQWFCIEKY
jgi:hypothetical protein